MQDSITEPEELKSLLRERVDLSFLEFMHFTQHFTIPQIRQAIDELIGETPGASPVSVSEKPKRRKWTGVAFVEVDDDSVE